MLPNADRVKFFDTIGACREDMGVPLNSREGSGINPRDDLNKQSAMTNI